MKNNKKIIKPTAIIPLINIIRIVPKKNKIRNNTGNNKAIIILHFKLSNFFPLIFKLEVLTNINKAIKMNI